MDRVAPNIYRFVLTLLILYLFTSGSGPARGVLDQDEEVIKERRARSLLDIQTLANQTFAQRQRLASDDDLTRIAKLTRQYDLDSSLPLYKDVSSYPMGSWRPHVGAPHENDSLPNTLAHFFRQGARHGQVSTHLLSDKRHGNLSEVRLRAWYASPSGWQTREITLEGLHDTRTGQIWLAADRNGTHGLTMVPSLVQSESVYYEVRDTAVKILSERLAEGLFAALDEPDEPSCSIYAAVQVHRQYGQISDFEMTELEYLDHQGRPHTTMQPVTASMHTWARSGGNATEHLATDPCAFSIEVETTGPRTIHVRERAQNHVLFGAAVAGLLLWVNVRLMGVLTASSLARLSFWWAAGGTLSDGYLAIGALIIAIANKHLLLQSFTLCFILVLQIGVIGLRMLLLIFKMQRQLPQNQTPTPPPPPPPQPAQTPIDQLPITNPLRTPRNLPASPTPTPDPPVAPISEAEQERRAFGVVYFWFYIALFGLLGGSLGISHLSPAPRRLCILVLCLAGNSSIFPAIVRLVIRGHRPQLPLATHIIILGLLRSLPAFYVLAFPHNVFHLPSASPFSPDALLLVAHLLFQSIVLLSQELLGPRWFIPSLFHNTFFTPYPHPFDYHNLVPAIRKRAGLPLHPPDHSEAAIGIHPPASDKQQQELESCPICMSAMEIPCPSTRLWESGVLGDDGKGLVYADEVG
ncbi:hypothetical protein PYCC9005_004761 [Savitreella phatthalungensis]